VFYVLQVGLTTVMSSSCEYSANHYANALDVVTREVKHKKHLLTI